MRTGLPAALLVFTVTVCAQSNDGKAPEEANGEPAADEAPVQQPAAETAVERTRLNLLGEVNSRGGEGRRNENVRLTLIDNNVLKELNERMGTTATVVEEFDAGRNYFGAEFGGNPSSPLHLNPAQIAGTHGQLDWGHNNSIFSARSFFQAGPVQPARTNDYGFSVSALLRRGTSLTVQGSQRKLRGQVNGNVLVPAPDERTPLTTDPARRALVEAILGAFPAQAPNRTDINERALNTNAPQNIDNDRIGGSIDHAAGTRDRLLWRYNLTLQNVEAFQLVGGQNPDTTTRNHDARMTWSRSWSPATTTELSAGFERVGSLLVPEETSIGMFYRFARVLESIGPSGNIPLDRAQNMFRYAGQLRTVRSRHTVTAGFAVLRRQINGFESNEHRGIFNFRNDFGRDTITNLRLGEPSAFRVALGSAHRGFREWTSQWFAGDTWRLRPGLTLNFGLRYEPYSRPVEVHALSEIPYDCDCNNLAPTFGFAWRPSPRLGVLRGAYGLQYGQIFPAAYMQARFNPPSTLQLEVAAPDLVSPLRDFRPQDLDPDARSAVFDLDPELAAPYSHQYNFSWELPLVRDWKLELGYVGSRTHKLLTAWYLNRAQAVEGIPLTTATVNDRRPDPRFFEVQRVLNGSRGYFDAGKVTLRIPSWAGLAVDGSYWFSKAIDLGGDYTGTASGRDARQGRSPSEFDIHAQMKALSIFDQPHAMLWRVNYETPAVAAPGRWLDRVLGRWQLSSVVLLKSGTPFELESGSDAPGFGNVDGASSDRPNLVDPSVLGRSVDHPDTSLGRMPAEAFSPMLPGQTHGNLGRNTFRKDGIVNVNAALSRRWTLGGDRWLLFRAESLNFLNHPQFESPGAELSSPNFGQITNTLNDGRAFRFSLRLGF